MTYHLKFTTACKKGCKRAKKRGLDISLLDGGVILPSIAGGAGLSFISAEKNNFPPHYSYVSWRGIIIAKEREATAWARKT